MKKILFGIFILLFVPFFTCSQPIIGAGSGITIQYEDSPAVSPQLWLTESIDYYLPFSETLSLFIDNIGELTYTTDSGEINGVISAACDLSFRKDNIVSRFVYSSFLNCFPIQNQYSWENTAKLFLSAGSYNVSAFISPSIMLLTETENTLWFEGTAGTIFIIADRYLLEINISGGFIPSNISEDYFISPGFELNWYFTAPLTLSLNAGYKRNVSSDTEIIVSGESPQSINTYHQVSMETNISAAVTNKTNMFFSLPVYYTTMEKEWILHILPELSFNINLFNSTYFIFTLGLDNSFSNSTYRTDKSFFVEIETEFHFK